MADKAWTKFRDYNNAEIWEVELDSTDFTTEYLGLDNMKIVTVGVKTTGAAEVNVNATLQNPSDVTKEFFVYEAAVKTQIVGDWLRSALGPISGLKIVGTIAGADTAKIQVMQSPRK